MVIGNVELMHECLTREQWNSKNDVNKGTEEEGTQGREKWWMNDLTNIKVK